MEQQVEMILPGSLGKLIVLIFQRYFLIYSERKNNKKFMQDKASNGYT